MAIIQAGSLIRVVLITVGHTEWLHIIIQTVINYENEVIVDLFNKQRSSH